MKRILFVDDEPRILDGLRRLLRSQRRTWDMKFVEGPQAALEAMEQEPFDVVVTDMRMPGMDGARLLEVVKERHPRTVRIILSGYADLEASMRSVSVSHQFLVKPCDAEELRRVVDRACSLEAVLQAAVLREAVGAMTHLPPLPRVYQALTVALTQEDIDIEEVGRIVEQDPALTAKILQLVNSSYFGIRREILEVEQATIYLGAMTIRDLVLSFEVFKGFEDAKPVRGFDMDQEQRHSLLAGAIARRILPEKPARDQAFLAAMLHDVGRLILATRIPDLAAKVYGEERDEPLHEAEEAELGVSHAEIGAYLLGLWGMPYPVVEAVAHHHRPARVGQQDSFGLLAATHVASALAHEQCQGARADDLDLDYLASLGVLERLPEWRSIAEEEAGTKAEAA